MPCTDGDCVIQFNEDRKNDFWTSSSFPPLNVIDMRGVTLHEIGHWIGLRHNDECTVPDYSPDPYGDMNSMCFDQGTESGGEQRTPSQDDIQGANYMLYKFATVKRWFSANPLLGMCGAPPGDDTDGECIPTYWIVDPLNDSTHEWVTAGNGRLKLDVSGSHPEVEVVQNALGWDVDQNNSGTFRINYRVKAVSGTPTITVFLENATTSKTCSQQITTTWTDYDCEITNFTSFANSYSFGVRATNDIWITRIRIRDKCSGSCN